MLVAPTGLSRVVVVATLASAVLGCGDSTAKSPAPDGMHGSAGQSAGAGHAAGAAAGSAAASGESSGAAGSGGANAAAGHVGMAHAGAGAGASGRAAGSGASAGAGSAGRSAIVMPSQAALQTFPSGLAVGSPVQLQQPVGPHAQLSPRPGVRRYLRDFGRTLRGALARHDLAALAGLLSEFAPISTASAAPADELELKALAASVERVLAGDPLLSWSDVLDLDRLFAAGGNANCYGPSLAYAHHENAGGASDSGTFPGGDLGLWLEYEAGAQPCVAAQLNRRIEGVKGKTQQGLLLMAALRRSVEASASLLMPEPSATTDVTAEFEAKLHAAPKFASVDVRSATIARDASGSTYTYRVVFDKGGVGAATRFGEIVMVHTPGSTDTSYQGVMRVASFSLSGDAAFGCNDAKDSASSLFQVADVSTVNYRRADSKLAFSSRSGNYCGHPGSAASTSYATEVAAFTGAGELDPLVKLTSSTRGSSKGWRGNFARFAGDYDLDTVEGDFLYAWQAGPLDSNARSLALDASYNSVTQARTLQGFFGFAGEISTSNGALLGMICNWAGPGNSHTPEAEFQSQTATLSAGSTNFVIPSGGSKLSYAPTNSCSSTTTEFDKNADQTLALGEGAGTLSDLDVPSGGRSVQQEIESRGFALPSLY
jgi:hypothetical protein